MLGEQTFQRCYDFIRRQHRKKKEREEALSKGRTEIQPSSSSNEEDRLMTKAEQEATLRSWLESPDLHSAIGHITSLIFCEDLMAKFAAE